MRIVGIDPGTSTMGICKIHLDKDLNIIKLDTELIDVSRSKSKNFRHTLDIKLNLIGDRLKKILEEDDTFSLILERPFFNPRRPSAVLPLAKLMGVIFNISTLFKDVFYREYTPMTVKAAVGRGDSDKDDMKVNVERYPYIRNFIDVDKISEHEIDAIAVCIAEIQLLKSNPHLLFPVNTAIKDNINYRKKEDRWTQ